MTGNTTIGPIPLQQRPEYGKFDHAFLVIFRSNPRGFRLATLHHNQQVPGRFIPDHLGALRPGDISIVGEQNVVALDAQQNSVLVNPRSGEPHTSRYVIGATAFL